MAQDQAKPRGPDLTQGIAVPAQKEKWFWNWFAGQDRA